MKKVFYDSWLAKAILFPSYSTITLFAWVLLNGPRQMPGSQLSITNVSMPVSGLN